MQRKGQKKQRAYFEITEDPPHVLPPLRTTRRNSNTFKLPSNNKFFFIDFAQECQLRLMQKRNGEFGEPLQIEKYGKNVIINVEDSSLSQGQLVKYEEQQLSHRERRVAIECRLKERLDKDRKKIRSKSLLAIRQELIQQYTQPIQLPRKSKYQQNISQVHSSSPKKVDDALKRLGLIKESRDGITLHKYQIAYTKSELRVMRQLVNFFIFSQLKKA